MQDKNNFVVYKSSAGSGKTFTLVKAYLTIALADEGFPNTIFRHILAITFTKKAAHEMKERILMYLKSIAAGERQIGDTMVDLLSEALKIDFETLQKRCKNLQSSILHRYSDFSVTTIDSFSYRIIKSFEFELQLPGGVQIESDKDYVIDLCIAQLLDKTGEEEEITNVLLAYIDQSTEDEKNWDIQKKIYEFGKKALKEDHEAKYNKLKDIAIDDILNLRKKMDESIIAFQNKIKKIGEAAFNQIDTLGFEESDFFYGSSGFYGLLRKIKNTPGVQILDIVKSGLNSYIKKTLNEDKWYSTKIDKDRKNSFESIKNEISKYLVELDGLISEELDKIKLQQKVMSNIFNIALINQLNQIIKAYKEQHNTIFISEFNQLISKVIQEEPVPFIYEKLGDKYRYYLIDEFQDTSTLQFTNLLPLIENSLSQGYSNMIVGDGKQAIYRWREGNVELFSQLPKLIDDISIPLKAEKQQQLEYHFKKENLLNNFRSKQEIIVFNNLLYTYFAQSDIMHQYTEAKSIYADLEQNYERQKTGGYVEVLFLEKPTEQDFEDETEEQPSNRLNITLEKIADCITDGYQYKDIAIICRSNREAINIAEFLKQQNIEIVSNDALRLWNNDLIKFIVHVFQYLLQVQDKITQYSILKFLSAQNLLPIRFENAINSLQEQSFKSFIQYHFPRFNDDTISTLPIDEMAIEIFETFQLHLIDNGYFNYFLNELLAYKEKYSSSLIDFLTWWEEKQDNLYLKIPESKNAITIITIHRSKGLQFPIVIMPFANWRTSNYDEKWIDIPADSGIELETAYFQLSKPEDSGYLQPQAIAEMNKQNLDNLNLLYVATTRAMDRLYMIADQQKGNAKKNVSAWLYQMAIQQANFSNQKLIYGDRKNQNRAPIVDTDLVQEQQHFRFQSNIDKIILKRNSENIWSTHEQKETEFGNKIHYILSHIYQKQDLKKAVAAAIQKGIINSQEEEIYTQYICQIIDQESALLFFNDQDEIKTEQEILLKDNTLIRVDRICIDIEQNVKILDYKTGNKKQNHIEQMHVYIDAMKALGYPKVSAYLLYTTFNEIMPVI